MPYFAFNFGSFCGMNAVQNGFHIGSKARNIQILSLDYPCFFLYAFGFDANKLRRNRSNELSLGHCWNNFTLVILNWNKYIVFGEHCSSQIATRFTNNEINTAALYNSTHVFT